VQTNLRRSLAVVALVVSVSALAACSRGFSDPTDASYQPAQGVNDRAGQVDVLGAVVVSNATGGSGVLIASFSNNDQTRSDKLTAVAGQGVTVASGAATPTIPAGDLVNLADPKVGGITLTGAGVKAGGYVLLRLTFQHADPVTLRVPIVLDSGSYASLGPSPAAG
jgi:hypothetical protein